MTRRKDLLPDDLGRPQRDAFRKRRGDKPIPDHVHGSANGYENYGCRCVPCTQAKVASNASSLRLVKLREEHKHSSTPPGVVEHPGRVYVPPYPFRSRRDKGSNAR